MVLMIVSTFLGRCGTPRVCDLGADQPRLGMVWESAGGTEWPHEMEDMILAARTGRQYFSTGPRSAALTTPVNSSVGGVY